MAKTRYMSPPPPPGDTPHADHSRRALTIEELDRLRMYLRGLVRGWNQRRIAESLGLSDPALSQFITKIEEQVGIPIRRGRKPDGVTGPGSEAFDHWFVQELELRLGRFLSGWSELSGFFQEFGHRDNRVSISGTRTAMTFWLPTFLHETSWLTRHPTIRLDISHDEDADRLRKDIELCRHDLLLGPAYSEASGMREVCRIRLNWGLIYSRHLKPDLLSRIESKPVVDLDSIASLLPFVIRQNPRHRVDRLLPHAGTRLYAPSFVQAMGMIRRGLVVGFGHQLHTRGSQNLMWRPIRRPLRADEFFPDAEDVALYGQTEPAQPEGSILRDFRSDFVAWLREVEKQDRQPPS